MSGCGEDCYPRLQECQHGCKKHLGDIISFFFRFISGNLARGEGCLAGTGIPGARRCHLGLETVASFWGGAWIKGLGNRISLCALYIPTETPSPQKAKPKPPRIRSLERDGWPGCLSS